MTICFVFILFGALYFKEQQRVFSVALNNSIQVSNLHSDVISQELQRNIASLRTISGHQRVQHGDVPFIIEELKWLYSMSQHAIVNALFVDNKWNLVDYQGRKTKVTLADITEDVKWQQAQYHVTKPHIGLVTGEPLIALGVPVFDSQNEWSGIVAVSISVDYLSKRLAKVKLGNSSYAWIADNDGNVVSHPNNALILEANIFDADSIGFEGFGSIAQQTRQHDIGYGHYYDENVGEPKIVTFSTIDTLPGWTLFVTTEESDIFLDIKALVEDVTITLLVVTIVFMPIIFYLTNSVTRPILELTKDVKNSVSSHYTEFAGQNSLDEIGQLSNAFKNTIEEIQQHNRNLEDVVARRTNELNDANHDLAMSVKLLNENNQKLTWLAMYDPLTNLFNRRALINQVHQELVNKTMHSHSTSLILIDLDYFKAVNDTFGHDVGDQVLMHVADFLSANVRTQDLIARWGGEEFVILLRDTSIEQSEQIATNLQEKMTLENFSPVTSMTFSAGVATLSAGQSFDDLIANADKALYTAKKSGRNCVKSWVCV
ncbi:Diguanylate cyclase [Vibrio sp. B1ASS3]|uniref:sensor domain-containing diguanylate cyclase n=1 Tax=Vibrio sp. B1ASS3 TaxID=2751176 RepID=UPI001ABA8CD8|nr:diguanylate cyclase [Vibrio sp. B1ASS3]CAD7822707.1 Diguanylate cyclase [Vibrio sp. B1ASS3]CAE6948490.1 Diguanylate cyclase [Vibrio sp. B1ASS3]